MKYRVKSVENVGFFSQVNSPLSIFGMKILDRWETIGSHPNNTFGTYSENHTRYPLDSENDAEDRIEKYKLFVMDKEVTYKEYA